MLLRLTMFLLALALTACSRPPAAPSTQSGPRIVSTVPAATLVLTQIGAGDTLVGVSSFDAEVLPPEKQGLPVVGDYERMNYELLLKLRPTALLTFVAPEKTEQRLRDVTSRNNIKLVNVKFDRLDDMWKAVDVLAELTGRQREARTKVALARGELAAISQAVASRLKSDADKPRVLCTVAKDPIIVVGGRTFLDEVITLAGGRNVGAEVGVGYPTINRELCLKLRPDVVILSFPSEPPQQTADPRIKPWLNMDIPAAKSGRVHLLTNPKSQLATLDIAANVREVAVLLHPKAFEADAFGAPAASGPASASAPAETAP